MRTYTLRSGHTVTTMPLPAGRIEFVTRNPVGDTISSVVHPLADAVPLIRSLVCGAR